MSRLELVPISIADAQAFVAQIHRHHPKVLGGLFAVACADDSKVSGVAIVGRPVARNNADGWTAEVTRLATDGHPNACSMLYAAAWRACRALGYRRLVTAEAADAASLVYASKDGRVVPTMERLGQMLNRLSAALPEIEAPVRSRSPGETQK